MRSAKGVASVIVLGLLAAGCTEAQRRAMNMRSQMIAAAKEGASCAIPAQRSPRFAALWVHTPRPPAAPSIDQLADESYASPPEVLLVKTLHDETAPCRAQLLDRLEAIDPRLAVVFSDHFNASDQILLDLVRHQKTWGQANQAGQQLKAVTRKQLLAAAHDIDGELAQQNAAELEQRRESAQRIAAGFAAVVQASAAVAEAAEAAKEARQASRPVITSCNQFLNNTTCVSR